MAETVTATNSPYVPYTSYPLVTERASRPVKAKEQAAEATRTLGHAEFVHRHRRLSQELRRLRAEKAQPRPLSHAWGAVILKVCREPKV